MVYLISGGVSNRMANAVQASRRRVELGFPPCAMTLSSLILPGVWKVEG